MRETWKDVPWAPGYSVSSLGRVRGRKRNLLKMSIDSGGYHHVILYVGGKRFPRKVHRLVLEGFVGPRPDGLEACHRNGIRTDNRLGNLRWDTHEANIKDRVAHGGYATQHKGESHHAAKLSEDDVRTIRAVHQHRVKGRNSVALGKTYGVTHNTILRIVSGAIWSHIQ